MRRSDWAYLLVYTDCGVARMVDTVVIRSYNQLRHSVLAHHARFPTGSFEVGCEKLEEDLGILYLDVNIPASRTIVGSCSEPGAIRFTFQFTHLHSNV